MRVSQVMGVPPPVIRIFFSVLALEHIGTTMVTWGSPILRNPHILNMCILIFWWLNISLLPDKDAVVSIASQNCCKQLQGMEDALTGCFFFVPLVFMKAFMLYTWYGT